MSLVNGLRELDRLQSRFIDNEISIHQVQVGIFSAIVNNTPAGTLHPSDHNEIDRIANDLASQAELIAHTSLPTTNKLEVAALIERAKLQLGKIHEIYPKRLQRRPSKKESLKELAKHYLTIIWRGTVFSTASSASFQKLPLMQGVRSHMNQNNVERAIDILEDDCAVLYGIFGFLEGLGYFPPHIFLNRFLIQGYDPCDQDGRMDKWVPFEISDEEYQAVLEWWKQKEKIRICNESLGTKNWNDWIARIMEEEVPVPYNET